MENLKDFFHTFARKMAEIIGSPLAFILATILILLWLGSGPLFHFSDTWQLVINTGTTIVTFLIVFLIQNTQNRDAHSIHIKLDELIRIHKKAKNFTIDLEKLNDDELIELEKKYEELSQRRPHNKPTKHYED